MRMDKTPAPPRFVIKRAGLRKNKFRVLLVGANYETIAVTQPYASIHIALDACSLINPSYFVVTEESRDRPLL